MRLFAYFLSATTILLPATAIRAERPTSAETSGSEAIQFKLTEFVHRGAQRTTFRLHIEKKRQGLSVTAGCDLRRDGKGVGRFPLASVASVENPNTLSFRISCLHDDFVEDTIIHLLVRDEATGKSVDRARIRLTDAEGTRSMWE